MDDDGTDTELLYLRELEIADVPDEPDGGTDEGDDGGTNDTALIVDTLIDENDGLDVGGVSLREALAAVEPGGTITFAAGLTGTIALNGTELVIDRPLNIAGNGNIAIDAGGLSRVFFIDDNADTEAAVAISGLTIGGGSASLGGGIFSGEDLTLSNSTIAGNVAAGDPDSSSGGGIVIADGSLTLVESTVSDNAANTIGGGILGLAGTTLDLSGSIFSNNSATDGGAVVSNSGILNLTASTVSGNSAAGSGGGVLLVAPADTGQNAAPASIVNSTISNNTAAGEGGGLFNLRSTVLLSNSTVTANTAGTDSIDRARGRRARELHPSGRLREHRSCQRSPGAGLRWQRQHRSPNRWLERAPGIAWGPGSIDRVGGGDPSWDRAGRCSRGDRCPALGCLRSRPGYLQRFQTSELV